MSGGLQNKGMKQTSVERIGRSQLIPSVLRTLRVRRTVPLAGRNRWGFFAVALGLWGGLT
jgi:hypothetical protein